MEVVTVPPSIHDRHTSGGESYHQRRSPASDPVSNGCIGKANPAISSEDWLADEAVAALTPTDPIVAAGAAATIATALALVHGLPCVLAERNWTRRRDGIAAARGAVARALRADLRDHLSPEELAILEAARERLRLID